MDETNYEDTNDYSDLTSGSEENLQTNDPIQEELNRVKPVRSEADKAVYTFKKQMERMRELGIDPSNLIENKNQIPIWIKVHSSSINYLNLLEDTTFQVAILTEYLERRERFCRKYF